MSDRIQAYRIGATIKEKRWGSISNDMRPTASMTAVIIPAKGNP